MRCGDAHPLILDGDFHVAAGLEGQIAGPAHLQVLSADFHQASGGHGLNSIDDEILEDLADLPGVRFHRPEVIRQAEGVFDLGTATIFLIGAPPREKVSNCWARFWAC